MKCKHWEPGHSELFPYCKCHGNLPDSPSWKSVRDELPKQGGVYLCAHLDQWIMICMYLDNEWRDFEHDETYVNPTHWQPLPSPPEVKE